MREAIRLAIEDEMAADSSVIVFGEDVADAGGVFKVTEGLLEKFGPARVRDTPIAETAIIGAAVGAALTGLRPVVEIMFAEFYGVALDQVNTEAAKMRFLSAGRLHAPMVIRGSAGGGLGFGAQHSQTLESWFLNTPGLTVVVPSSSRSAYRLMRASIRSDDPVIFLEPRALYGVKAEMGDLPASAAELGRAEIVSSGTDITLIALGRMVRTAQDAAVALGAAVSCEVIDLQTIRPWDRAAVVASVSRTGRAVIVEENPLMGGWGGDVASHVAEHCFDSLKAPVARVSCPDVPVPYGSLEKAYLPSVDDLVDVVRHAMTKRTPHTPRWSGWSGSGESAPAGRRESDSEQVARRSQLKDPLECYERMVEIRLVEDAVRDLYAEGLISGSTHTCDGQEAIAVGVAATLRPTDYVTCTYRGHGMALALGMTPLGVIAEILGRRDGCIRGKGGTMHLSAPMVGLLPTFAIVGAGLPVAAGAALTAQITEDDSVAVAMFGDGATNIGAFHESLNLAAVWRLPVVFICENNLYGEYSPLARTTAVEDIAARGAAYRMPSAIVDGQDLAAVSAAVATAVDRARAGGGPTLLEMKTYRFVGHSRSDPAKYRPAGELERWKARDPLTLAAAALVSAGRATDADLERRRASTAARVAAAVEAARNSPPPDRAEMMRDVTA